MPTQTKIIETLIPREAEKPIPVRVVSTRATPRPPKPVVEPGADGALAIPETAAAASPSPNRDQGGTGKEAAAAESAAAEASVKLSPQLSALARKEQAFRERELALKERERALEVKLAGGDRFESLKAKLAAKDFSELETLGLTYEEYTNYLLARQNGEKPETQAFKKLETEISEMKKKQEESQAAQFEDTVSEYRKEIAALVSKDPAYSTVKELKHEEAVLQIILDAWEEDDEEVSVEQAAKDVEDFLIEEAVRMASATKVKARLGEGEKKPLPPPKPGLKTLTQQVVAGSEKRPLKTLQNMSESERYAEARRRVQERREQENRNR